MQTNKLITYSSRIQKRFEICCPVQFMNTPKTKTFTLHITTTAREERFCLRG